MTASSKAPPTARLTSTEFGALHVGLEQYVVRLRAELSAAEGDLGANFGAYHDPVGDDADRGAVAGDLELNVSLAGNAQQLLAQCELALDRMRDNRYGLCDGCGGPIAKERLRALPHATLCMACRQDHRR